MLKESSNRRRAARWCKLFGPLCALGLLSTSSLAKPSSPSKPAHVAKITLANARAAALALVPGTIKAEELEKEHGRWIYSFEIRPSGEKRKLIKEVNLDADTGAQVGAIDTERDD